MIWLTLYVNDYDKQSCSFASNVTIMCKIFDYGRIKMFLKIYLEVEIIKFLILYSLKKKKKTRILTIKFLMSTF